MKLISEPLLYRSSEMVKFLSFLLIILLSLLFTLIIGMAIGIAFFGSDMIRHLTDGLSLSDPAMMPMLKYLQIINTLGLFVFPPLIFAYLVSKRPLTYLSMLKSSSIVSAVLGIAVIVVILPFLHWTAGLNEMLSLPECLSGIEDWMIRSEEQAKEITELFLGTTNFPGLIINMMMIAVLPALGEELLFRAVLLRIFKEWTKNAHIAVLLSAFLFSALHLQFYGFLPRLILGIILGYLFIWSRSIWLPVIVHFFNNGIAVLAAWLFERGQITSDAESLGDEGSPFIIVASLIMFLLLLVIIRQYEAKKKEAPHDDASFI